MSVNNKDETFRNLIKEDGNEENIYKQQIEIDNMKINLQHAITYGSKEKVIRLMESKYFKIMDNEEKNVLHREDE